MSRRKVLALAPRWFIRPRNTDWRHLKLLESGLQSGSDRWSVHLRDSLSHILAFNTRYLSQVMRRRFSGRKYKPDYLTALLNSDRIDRYDAIYAYGNFPRHNFGKPVVWHDAPTDRAALLSAGFGAADIDREIELKGECLKQCDVCAVSSDHAKSEMLKSYGGQADKIIVLPFFLPYLVQSPLDRVIEKHHRNERVKILFVGREARRKGLDMLLDALASTELRSANVQLDIVTSFADGAIPVPDDDRIRILGERSATEVQALMREAHIFAMPSRRESYGIVFIEAMAAGAVPLTMDREPQRSLFAHGKAGSLINGGAQEIARELLRLAEDREARLAKAVAAWTLFHEQFSNDAVSAAYGRAFDMATSRHIDVQSAALTR
jgi:glycosyltransferase involved in cell wall biosynthesis